MPLKNYRLVIGQPLDWTLDDDGDPHIELLLDVAGEKYRAAVNVRSSVAPHTLLYRRLYPFVHPITAELGALASGSYDLRGSPLALDYVRDGMIMRAEMEELPYRSDGVDNDLLEKLLPTLQQGIAEAGTQLYLFGETWGPETKPDAYFHFTPGRGIHDIHMNQGSQGSFRGTNGIHQDGGLLIRHPDQSWSAILLAFASQSWQTDAQGHPSGEIIIDHPVPTLLPIRVIAALINPYNPEAGRETVTLLNLSDKGVNLDGWQLQDGEGRSEPLTGYDIGAGDAARVRLTGSTMLLKNKAGGRIRLLAPGDVLVQELVYDKDQLGQEGWSVLF